MSNAAIITLARSVGNSLSRLWWPLKSGLTDKASWLLWSLAARLQQSDEELRVARNRVAELSALQLETAQDRSDLRKLCDQQELTIARLAGELTAERERCARLILQQKRKVAK
jgi:hypothetical protein